VVGREGGGDREDGWEIFNGGMDIIVGRQ